MIPAHTIDIFTFYDEHPLNAAEVMSRLEESGADLDNLAPEALFAHDQDHYGGTQATDALVAPLALGAGTEVLDVCSGLGGTCRYLAHRFGCRVMGVDLNHSRVAGAEELTRLVGLEDRVRCIPADATDMPFAEGLVPEGHFDVALGQEAFLHIPDKAALFANIHRALRVGGKLAFTDWIAFPTLNADERDAMRRTIVAQNITGLEEYHQLVEAAGFHAIQAEDLSTPWKEILRARLEMFRNMEGGTVKRFGEKRHAEFIAAYVLFVNLISEGKLGGVRMHARK